MADLDLNNRQQRALVHLKSAGRIGNTEYQDLFGVAKRTAHRDLVDLVEKGILEKIGTTAKGTAYELRKGAKGVIRLIRSQRGHKGAKGAMNRTISPFGSAEWHRGEPSYR
jgi:DeoR/GlpR family transcriptional regulator of sugar metabolism